MTQTLTPPLLPSSLGHGDTADTPAHPDPFWDDLLHSTTNKFDPHADKLGVITPGGPNLFSHPVGAPPAGSPGYDPAGVGAGPDYAAGPPVPGEATPGKHPSTHVDESTAVVRHVIEEVSHGVAHVRARLVPVVANNVETTLLEANPLRTRALIKVVTSAAVVMIGPARQGGNQQLTSALIAAGAAYWPQATGDPLLTIESAAAVACYGTQSAGTVYVAVWEEQSDK